MCFDVYIYYVYSRYALCLLLQILLVAALDIKTRDAPTVCSINTFLSQYCKASPFFFFFYRGGANCSLCPGCPMGKDRRREQACSSVECIHTSQSHSLPFTALISSDLNLLHMCVSVIVVFAVLCSFGFI
jgi:hypothetical protein